LVVCGFGTSEISQKNLSVSLIVDEYDMVIIAPKIFSYNLQTLIDHKNSVDTHSGIVDGTSTKVLDKTIINYLV
jgi:hypothetical protein